jgi:hypothetical protein
MIRQLLLDHRLFLCLEDPDATRTVLVCSNVHGNEMYSEEAIDDSEQVKLLSISYQYQRIKMNSDWNKMHVIMKNPMKAWLRNN